MEIERSGSHAVSKGHLSGTRQVVSGVAEPGVQVDSSVAHHVSRLDNAADLLLLRVLLVVVGRRWSASNGPVTAQTAQGRPNNRLLACKLCALRPARFVHVRDLGQLVAARSRRRFVPWEVGVAVGLIQRSVNVAEGLAGSVAD